MKKLYIVVVAIALMSISAFASNTRRDIVDTAAQAGSFNTLTKALKAADLVDTLKGPGPFTVFADVSFTTSLAATHPGTT